MAGTGKSTTLRAFIRDSIKRVDVTAPTGVAALNVGGMTIHRFCGIMVGPQAGQSNEEYYEILRRDPRRSILAGFNRVRRCEVLVVGLQFKEWFKGMHVSPEAIAFYRNG